MALTALDHLVLTVRDLEATLRFYCDALEMEKEAFSAADGSTRIALKFGRQKVNLHRAGQEFVPHAAAPVPGSADLCFLTDRPLAEWQERLARFEIPLLEGPVPRTGATGPLTSLYIRDPDGALIEISVLGEA